MPQLCLFKARRQHSLLNSFVVFFLVLKLYRTFVLIVLIFTLFCRFAQQETLLRSPRMLLFFCCCCFAVLIVQVAFDCENDPQGY